MLTTNDITTMENQAIERGAAEMRIVLEDGCIQVYHGEGPLLAELENAPEGTWSQLWEFMQNTLGIRRLGS